MKKIIKLLLTFTFVILISGCGSKKTLECSMDQSNKLSGLGNMNETLNIQFIGRKIEKINLKMNLEITSNKISNSEMLVFKSFLNKICSDGFDKNIPFPKCDINQDGKKLTLDATVIRSEIKDKSRKYSSVTKTEKELKKKGYKCKIKKNI